MIRSATLLMALGLIPGPASPGRIAPPPAVTCARDHLTAFMGRILEWRRSPVSITFKVRTDEATTREFSLRFAETEDTARSFLMEGGAFGAGDWRRIESAPGTLREGMRAIVWVCDDASRPLLDWRPPEPAPAENKKRERP